MNIIVKTYSGKIIVRPDTTLEKYSTDLYLQDCIHIITFTPILFAHICKAGKGVSLKFARRYFDSVNYGILLYPENLIDGCEEGFACASCMDHSSYLPDPMFPKTVPWDETNAFSLCANGKEIHSTGAGSLNMIEEAIAEATAGIYIRTGDMVAIELNRRSPLMERATGNVHVQGSYLGNTLLDFNIIAG